MPEAGASNIEVAHHLSEHKAFRFSRRGDTWRSRRLARNAPLSNFPEGIARVVLRSLDELFVRVWDCPR